MFKFRFLNNDGNVDIAEMDITIHGDSSPAELEEMIRTSVKLVEENKKQKETIDALLEELKIKNERLLYFEDLSMQNLKYIGKLSRDFTLKNKDKIEEGIKND